MQNLYMNCKLFLLGMFIVGFFCSPSIAANQSPEVFPLWAGIAPGSEGYDKEEITRDRGSGNDWVTQVSRPTLTVYFPEEAHRNGTGVVICPGGGYGGLSIDKEGHAFAQWFVKRGVVAGVLKYRHGGGKHQHPVPLNDAQRALRIMRSKAKVWQLDANKIGIAGFSAGGHLAATAGTRFDQGDATADDIAEHASCRANFLVLVYPVISMQAGVTHGGSKRNLLGKSPDEQLTEELSNELQVSAETGPTILVHASDDAAVPVENSLLFYRALRKHRVSAELHVYEAGGHGFGFYRGNRPIDRWPDLVEGWLKQQELIP